MFRTAEHASSKTLYDHAFSAICFSFPDGKDMYIASGSRTDHGEVKDNDGLYPGSREVALTSCIFKLPANTEKLLLPNDSTALAPYVHVRGVRNAFSMAFAANGDLFSVENSGDRDDPEEMNWIGPAGTWLSWEMGGNDTPMQFADYKADDDKLVNRAYTAHQIGAFHDDKLYPQTTKPRFLTTNRSRIPDRMQTNTGILLLKKVVDASDKWNLNRYIHRTPLAASVSFSTRNRLLVASIRAKGFVLSYQEGLGQLMVPCKKLEGIY